MKVLHVTPVAPGMMSGGEQGIRQSLLMLCGCKNMIDQLDYAGPPIAEEHLKKKYDNLYELKADSSAAATIVTLLQRQIKDLSHGKTAQSIIQSMTYFIWILQSWIMYRLL